MIRAPERELQLVYTLYNHPYMWRCTCCSKAFIAKELCVTAEELDLIWKEFRSHSCLLYITSSIQQIGIAA